MVFLSRTSLHDRVDATAPEDHTTLGAALRISGYRAALTASLGNGWALFGVRSSLIPLFVTEGIGASGTWTGIGLLVSAATQGGALLMVGNLTDRVGRRPGMIAGAALGTLSLGALAVHESLGVYVVSMAVFGVASAFLTVAPSAAVGDVVSGRGGTVVAAFQMAGRPGRRGRPAARRLAVRQLLLLGRMGGDSRHHGGRAGHGAVVDRDAAPTFGGIARAGRRDHRLTGAAQVGRPSRKSRTTAAKSGETPTS